MTALVVAYCTAPEDEHLTLKVECVACHIEWGWSRDSAEANARLEQMAADHNSSEHPPGATPTVQTADASPVLQTA